MIETTASGAAPRPAEPGAGLPPAPSVVQLHEWAAERAIPLAKPDFPSWAAAGFAEIIPVAPPEARIAPGSDLKPSSLGKVPAWRLPDGTWTGLAHWSVLRGTRADHVRWMSSGANIGLQAAGYAGVDIDIADPALLWLVDLVHDAATLMLGWAPSGVGSPPKRLLMFKSTQPIRRRRIVFRKPGD